MEAKVTSFSVKKTLNLRGKLYDLSHPLVMGILNVTPDSFYDGGRYTDQGTLEERLKQLIQEGADIIDIGGYSTRPGAKNITAREEINRVIPAIEMAKAAAPGIPVSVDTFRAKVAESAIHAGADMVNDVSGGNLDDKMFKLIADKQLPYVLMHMRGDPRSMSSKSNYTNVVIEVIEELQGKLSALRDLGVNDVIVDPGFGFAKNAEQSFELLKKLEVFQMLDAPVMVGVSRKSMIYKTLNTLADDALVGTTALNTIALFNGASLLRVHDVRAAHQMIKLFMKMQQST
ncbi:MAG: dihydropteroate synthase [Cyclobacteriaceae bacterium]|nr:MAG: dihydropteroate synthase [Cyclobacteriaceae bacterium]